MKLVFGGAYQGKLEYAKEKYEITDNQVLDLRELSIDESAEADAEKACRAIGEEAVEDTENVEKKVLKGNTEAEDAFAKVLSEALNDPEKRALYKLDELVYEMVKKGAEARNVFKAVRPQLEDRILICDDVSQGLVPMDPVDREFREALGRALLYLGQEADEVVRIFCGLGHRIK